ncbi:MAG: helix-turn-helix transcriptional regulator [Spirochaetes bacterium]|nr:helix-turn-helix transcriptional regulator [Spirochaetota bacterium]
MHIEPIQFGIYRPEDCYVVSGCKPKGFTFIYVLDGAGKFCDDTRCIHAAPGDMIILPSENDYRIKTRSQSMRCYTTVVFPCGMGNGEIAELITARMPKIAIGINRRWFFEAIRSRLSSPHAYAQKAAFYSIVSLIYEINMPHPEHAAESAAVESALREIQRRIAEPAIDVGQLAGLSGLNRSYFIRLFKSRVGVPPRQYFLRLKVEASQPLLSRTELPVHKIADDFGFADQFHFSRIFKKWTGVSPRTYRENGARA